MAGIQHADIDHTGLTGVGGGSSAFVGTKAYRAGTQTLATATATAVNLATEEYDSDAFHDNATNNTRFTVPSGKAGKYALKGKVMFGADANGERVIWFRLNGTTTIRGSACNIEPEAAGITQLTTACDVAL